MGASPVHLRPAIAGDFDDWLALFETVAAEGMWMGAEAPLDRAARKEHFDQSLATDDSVVYLAEVDGRLVGALNIGVRHGVADLGMFVARGHRGAGVGSALVEAAIAWARAKEAHKITLAVWPHNHAALALYAKYGFETEGIRRRHARRRNGELWDFVLMGLVLDHTTPGGPDPDTVPAPTRSPRTT